MIQPIRAAPSLSPSLGEPLKSYARACATSGLNTMSRPAPFMPWRLALFGVGTSTTTGQFLGFYPIRAEYSPRFPKRHGSTHQR
jgi:hypothetical protein